MVEEKVAEMRNKCYTRTCPVMIRETCFIQRP